MGTGDDNLDDEALNEATLPGAARENDIRNTKIGIFLAEASPNNRKYLEDLERREAIALGGRLGEVEKAASAIPVNPDRKKAEQDWLEYCKTNNIDLHHHL